MQGSSSSTLRLAHQAEAQAPHPAQVARLCYDPVSASLAFMQQDSSCLLFHSNSLQNAKGFPLSLNPESASVSTGITTSSSSKISISSSSGNSSSSSSVVAIAGPISDACFLRLRLKKGRPRAALAFLVVSPAANAGSVALAAWLRFRSRFARACVHMNRNDADADADACGPAFNSGPCAQILGFLDLPSAFGVRIAASVNVVAAYSSSARKILILAAKVRNGCSSSSSSSSYSISFSPCHALQCNSPVHGIAMSPEHLILGVKNGVRVWLLRPLVKSNAARKSLVVTLDQPGAPNSKASFFADAVLDSELVHPGSSDAVNASGKANGFNHVFGKGNNYAIESASNCCRSGTACFESLENGSIKEMNKVFSDTGKKMEFDDDESGLHSNKNHAKTAAICTANGYGYQHEDIVQRLSQHQNTKHKSSGANTKASEQENKCGLVNSTLRECTGENGTQGVDTQNAHETKGFQLRNGQIFHKSSMDDWFSQSLSQASPLSPLASSTSSSFSGSTARPSVSSSCILRSDLGNSHQSIEATEVTCTSVLSKPSSGMTMDLDVNSMFLPFRKIDEDGAKSTKSSGKPLRAVSIHALNSTSFIVLDSSGDLHLLTLCNSEDSGESQKEHRSTVIVGNGLRHLKCSMKVRMVSVCSRTSPASQKTILVSDGRHTIHFLKFSEQDLWAADGGNLTLDEMPVQVSVLQAMMFRENIRAMMLMSESASLVVTQGSMLTYSLSGS